MRESEREGERERGRERERDGPATSSEEEKVSMATSYPRSLLEHVYRVIIKSTCILPTKVFRTCIRTLNETQALRLELHVR